MTPQTQIPVFPRENLTASEINNGFVKIVSTDTSNSVYSDRNTPIESIFSTVEVSVQKWL